MKVRGTHYVDVELAEHQIREVVHKWLSKRYDLRVDRYVTNFIRDGKLMQSQEISAGSHSYDEEKVLRDATPFDEAVLKILRETRL